MSLVVLVISNVGNLIFQRITALRFKPNEHLQLKFGLSLLMYIPLFVILKGYFHLSDYQTFLWLIIAYSFSYISMWVFNNLLNKNYPLHIMMIFMKTTLIFSLLIDFHLGNIKSSFPLFILTIIFTMGLYLVIKKPNGKHNIVNYNKMFIFLMILIVTIDVLFAFAIHKLLVNNRVNIETTVLFFYAITFIISFIALGFKRSFNLYKIDNIRLYSPQIIFHICLSLLYIYFLSISLFLASILNSVSIIIVTILSLVIFKDKHSLVNYIGMAISIISFIAIAYLITYP
jgi:hypothetical protein